jgi:hypothetical protein
LWILSPARIGNRAEKLFIYLLDVTKSRIAISYGTSTLNNSSILFGESFANACLATSISAFSAVNNQRSLT